MTERVVICTRNDVDYLATRMAMSQGARTIEELVEMTGVCTECEGCKKNLDKILGSVCGCKEVSLKAVVDAVKEGANTVDKVGQLTGAGTGEDCGRCKVLIENIIELGR